LQKGNKVLKKAIGLLAVIMIALAALTGQRYYTWIAQMDDPFDETGIEIHRYMPAFVQNWGCAKLYARFGGKTLPPYGCQDLSDPTQWRKAG
jgi:hypothetical protein